MKMPTFIRPLPHSLRTAAVLAAFIAIASGAPAKNPDPAAELLARQGTIPLASAGRYVEPGTFLIQVEAKLGRPSARLPDGTWLYRQHEVENSAARGTLVVRFNHGRVASLALVTPAVAMAMTTPAPAEKILASSTR